MDEKIHKSIEAAYLEFKEEPMDDYYNNLFVGYFSRLRVKKIVEEIGLTPRIVLDVGCEAGHISIKLLKRGHNVISFDVCKPAIERFNKKIKKLRSGEKIKPFLALAQQIPLKNESVDAVVCSEVFEHMPHLDNVIKEIARISRKNAKLIVTFPNETLRKMTYPILKLFGINTGVEKEVTLYEQHKQDIIRRLKPYFRIKKIYSFPWYFKITHFLVCKKN